MIPGDARRYWRWTWQVAASTHQEPGRPDLCRSTAGFGGIAAQAAMRAEPDLAALCANGAIVMLHDAAEHDDFEPASVRALQRLVALLDERGARRAPGQLMVASEPYRKRRIDHGKRQVG
jgi:hypothetical protein